MAHAQEKPGEPKPTEPKRAVSSEGNSAATPTATTKDRILVGPPAPAVAPALAPLYRQTKPDGPKETAKPAAPSSAARSQDNPMAAVNDGGRMFLYLLPVLLLAVGGARLLRHLQERSGIPLRGRRWNLERSTFSKKRNVSAPRGGLLASLLGGGTRGAARQRGSDLRVLESVPMGGATLHLVEARGRIFLLGAGGAGVNFLAEFSDAPSPESEDFRHHLQSAAADLDALDMPQEEMPTEALVASLETVLKDTQDSLGRRTRKLRAARKEDARS